MILRSAYKTVWRILSSHTLALWVLGLMTLVVLAAGTLPQSARLSPEEQAGWDTEWETTASWLDTLGLSQIVGSGWFKMLCLLLVINMLAGILASFYRKLAFYRGNLQPKYRSQGNGCIPEGLSSLGRKPENTGTVVQIRGALGLPGLTLFHLGVVVIVLAGFWRGAIDFSDYVELSEGEVFSGQPGKFQRRQPPPQPFNAVLRLDRAEIVVRDGKYMGEFRGYFSYRHGDDSIQQAVVASNHPLRLGDFELHPKQNFGYSAWFERLKPDGSFSVLYIHFNVKANEWEEPWSGQKEQMVYFDNLPLYYSMKLNNLRVPIFELKVNQNEQVLFEGKLRPGNIVDLGAYKLLFRGVVPWMTFNLALDKGVTPIFVGFIVTLSGFLLHLLYRPRRVEWTVSENGWAVRVWVFQDDIVFEEEWHNWCQWQACKRA